jgi:hypothetical protein
VVRGGDAPRGALDGERVGHAGRVLGREHAADREGSVDGLGTAQALEEHSTYAGGGRCATEGVTWSKLGEGGALRAVVSGGGTVTNAADAHDRVRWQPAEGSQLHLLASGVGRVGVERVGVEREGVERVGVERVGWRLRAGDEAMRGAQAACGLVCSMGAARVRQGGSCGMCVRVWRMQRGVWMFDWSRGERVCGALTSCSAARSLSSPPKLRRFCIRNGISPVRSTPCTLR